MHQVLILLFVGSLMICPFISFKYAARKYKEGDLSKLKAYGFFLFINSLPIALFVILSLILVGIEELTGKAIIGDADARSFIILIAFGLLLLLNLSIIFIFYLRKIGREKIR